MDEKGKRVFPEYKWGERADHVRVTISAAGYDAVCLTVERCLLASASARRLAAGGQANCVATFRPEGYATITASSPKAGEFFVIELDLAGDILEEGCSLQEPPASARTNAQFGPGFAIAVETRAVPRRSVATLRGMSTGGDP